MTQKRIRSQLGTQRVGTKISLRNEFFEILLILLQSLLMSQLAIHLILLILL